MTGVSVPVLRAHFKRIMKSYGWRPTSCGQVVLGLGLLLNLAVVVASGATTRSSWTRQGGDLGTTTEWTIVAPDYSLCLSLLSILSTILVVGGVAWMFVGLHDRVVGYASQMLSRTVEGLCSNCDCSLAQVPAKSSGLVECPKCRNTYAETDIRPIARGGSR